MYYETCAAIVIVLDAADPSQFDEIKAHIKSILQQPQLAAKCICILANKMDLENATPIEKLQQILFDSSLIECKLPLKIFPTSTGAPQSFKDAIHWVAETLGSPPSRTSKIATYMFDSLRGLFKRGTNNVQTPSDQALQDDATFLRSFEQCTLVRIESNHFLIVCYCVIFICAYLTIFTCG